MTLFGGHVQSIGNCDIILGEKQAKGQAIYWKHVRMGDTLERRSIAEGQEGQLFMQ